MPNSFFNLTPLGYKIFLDRYSLKHHGKILKTGDTVLYRDKSTHQKEIGVVGAVEGHGDCLVEVINEHGNSFHRRDELDVPLETVEQTFQRVAKAAAQGDADLEREFINIFKRGQFIPAGRILESLGSKHGTCGSNCYVLPSPHDSRHGIFSLLEKMAECMCRGGGVGINYSTLRPANALVAGVNGRSSGSVSWIELFSFVTSLIIQGGCLPLTALMATDKGLIPAGELADRLEAGEVIRSQTNEGLYPFTAVFRNGVKPMVQLRVDNGMHTTVSEDHKMAALKDGKIVMIPAIELKAGDELLTLLGEGSDGNYKTLQPIEMETRFGTKPITLPTILDETLAYLVGYYQANGYDSIKFLSVAIPTQRANIRTQVITIMANLFDRSPRITPGDGEVENISIGSRNLMRWWEHNNLHKDGGSECSHIPELIMQSPSRVQAAFFAGWFDADGSDRKGKGGYGIDSISERAIRELQILLLQNGIVSRTSWQQRPNENWKPLGRVTVTGSVFKSLLSGWMAPWSKKDTLHVTSKTYLGYPSDAISQLGVSGKYYKGVWAGPTWDRVSYAAVKHMEQTLRAGGQLTVADKVSTLLRTIPSRLTADPVKVGAADTVDFEVQGPHKLCADGFLENNSRRGAQMAMLADWHPDILQFINLKRDGKRATGCNMSVIISDAFMECVDADKDWNLEFPDTRHPSYNELWKGDLTEWRDFHGLPTIVWETIKARELWHQLMSAAHASAEPGVWFQDVANAARPGGPQYICTNPCAEEPLPPNGVCCLGHMFLPSFVTKNFWSCKSYPEQWENHVDWSALDSAVAYAVRFLDAVVDLTDYPISETKQRQMEDRRIGLGTLGLGEMLIRLGLRYGSSKAIEFCDRLYKRIAYAAYAESIEMAKTRGACPSWDLETFKRSGFGNTIAEVTYMVEDRAAAGIAQHSKGALWSQIKKHGLRNICILTQAPTGTIGTMLNTSTGIEPYFAWEWERKGRMGSHIEVAAVVAEYRAVAGERQLPEYFVTAMELTPTEHVLMQAQIQKWTDASISKTVNCPNHYTVEQVGEIYKLLYESGCKGGTVYRDGCRDVQVLNLIPPKEPVVVEATPANTTAVTPEQYQKYKAALANTTYPAVRPSVTSSKKTPSGAVHVTLTYDPATGAPLEVFCEAGRSGSEVKALMEAMGRIATLVLRVNAETPQQRLQLLIAQLRGIGGNSSVGFGLERILSIPDGIGNALNAAYSYYNTQQTAVHPIAELAEELQLHTGLDICPSCQNLSLQMGGGCCSCNSCGFSRC